MDFQVQGTAHWSDDALYSHYRSGAQTRIVFTERGGVSSVDYIRWGIFIW
jgi:hypothetical protein